MVGCLVSAEATGLYFLSALEASHVRRWAKVGVLQSEESAAVGFHEPAVVMDIGDGVISGE